MVQWAVLIFFVIGIVIIIIIIIIILIIKLDIEADRKRKDGAVGGTGAAAAVYLDPSPHFSFHQSIPR